jgi:hypothetical protein
MIFCKGSKKNVRCLLTILNSYGDVSGQIVSKQKSKFYSGSIPFSRLVMISNLLGFNEGTTPFIYLGYPIFVGKPKSIHFRSIADKIKVKLASWKGSLLSIMGRVQLVKSVIHGMLVYSFHIYSWPRTLIKTLDMWIRNFIWSGDVTTRKICTVAWKKIGRPLDEGGLDIRSLVQMNDSLLLLLCWRFFSSNDQWAVLCRSRFLKNGRPRQSFMHSSIWSGIRRHIQTVMDNTRWVIGTRDNISFWVDTWLDESIAGAFNIPTSVLGIKMDPG